MTLGCHAAAGSARPADLQELARGGSALDTDASCCDRGTPAVWIKPEVPVDAVTIALFVVGVAMLAFALAGLIARRADVAPAPPRRAFAWLVYPVVLVMAALGAWWIDWRGPRPPE